MTAGIPNTLFLVCHRSATEDDQTNAHTVSR
jgi:hypothetical protein